MATHTASVSISAPALTAPVRAVATETVPVTVTNVLTGVLGWIGLGQLTHGLPLPPTPITSLFAAAWGVAREVESSTGTGRAALKPIVAAPAGTGRPPGLPKDAAASLTAAAPAQAVQSAAAADSTDAVQTEAEREQADAEFNMSVGWIPGLGTVYNAVSLASDFLEFSIAAMRGDAADMGDEIGDMAIDIIGMIPIVGAPLAATIHWAVAAPVSPDHAPSPVDDTITTDEDTPVTANVLTNDTDPDGDPLTTALSTQPSHGTATLTTDGTLTYTPDTNYNGADVFNYKVSDGIKNTTGTVTVTITPVNDPPTAGDDTLITDEDTPVIANLLTNDTDPDGDPLTTTLSTQPSHGTATLTTDGTLTYTPDTNYNGPDLLTYTATDPHGATDTATVNLTITPINDPPTAGDDTATLTENTSTVIPVLANDTDVDTDALTITGTTTPDHGTTSLTDDGTTITYTPTADYVGTDSFLYTVTDTHGATDTASVSLTITPLNQAPTATFTTDKPNAASGAVIGAITATDPDADTLTYTVSKSASKGEAKVYPDGTFRYDPTKTARHAASATNATTAQKQDSFELTVDDGNGGVVTLSVTVPIRSLNTAPTTKVTVQKPNSKAEVWGKVNATDADKDNLTFKVTKKPSKGKVVELRSGGGFTYKPSDTARKKAAAANATAADKKDSFKITVNDGHGGTKTVTVNVAIKPAPQTFSQKVAQFVKDTKGKVISAPGGSYPGQCVSLVKRYLNDVFDATPPKGNAINFAPRFATNKEPAGRQLSQTKYGGLTWHNAPGAPSKTFKDGDILVFGPAGTNGHIGIWYNGKLYDQNNGWRSGAQYFDGLLWQPTSAHSAGYSPYDKIAADLLGYWRKS